MAREMIENGYDISKSSYLLSDMVEDDRHYTDTEFTRAVFLIENGADVNGKALRGTPIFHAIIWGNLKSVKLLLDNGADINIRNQEGETPLSCAKRLGENEIVALLLKYGAPERLFRMTESCTMVVGWHVSSRAIRTGLVRTGTEVVNWDVCRLMRCYRCVINK